MAWCGGSSRRCRWAEFREDAVGRPKVLRPALRRCQPQLLISCTLPLSFTPKLQLCFPEARDMGSSTTQGSSWAIQLPCEIGHRALVSGNSSFNPAMVLSATGCCRATRTQSTEVSSSMAQTLQPKTQSRNHQRMALFRSRMQSCQGSIAENSRFWMHASVR